MKQIIQNPIDTTCEFCHGEDETVEHSIGQCPVFEHVRKEFEAAVTNVMPHRPIPDMNSIWNHPSRFTTAILLSNSIADKEIRTIIKKKSLNFIARMHKERNLKIAGSDS